MKNHHTFYVILILNGYTKSPHKMNTKTNQQQNHKRESDWNHPIISVFVIFCCSCIYMEPTGTNKCERKNSMSSSQKQFVQKCREVEQQRMMCYFKAVALILARVDPVFVCFFRTCFDLSCYYKYIITNRRPPIDTHWVLSYQSASQ